MCKPMGGKQRVGKSLLTISAHQLDEDWREIVKDVGGQLCFRIWWRT